MSCDISGVHWKFVESKNLLRWIFFTWARRNIHLEFRLGKHDNHYLRVLFWSFISWQTFGIVPIKSNPSSNQHEIRKKKTHPMCFENFPDFLENKTTCVTKIMFFISIPYLFFVGKKIPKINWVIDFKCSGLFHHWADPRKTAGARRWVVLNLALEVDSCRFDQDKTLLAHSIHGTIVYLPAWKPINMNQMYR